MPKSCEPLSHSLLVPVLNKEAYVSLSILIKGMTVVGSCVFARPLRKRGKSIQLSRRDTDLQYIVILGRSPPCEEWKTRVGFI